MSKSRTAGRRMAERADEPVGGSWAGKADDDVQAFACVEYVDSKHTLTACIEAL